jgi:hypothetical protein
LLQCFTEQGSSSLGSGSQGCVQAPTAAAPACCGGHGQLSKASNCSSPYRHGKANTHHEGTGRCKPDLLKRAHAIHVS